MSEFVKILPYSVDLDDTIGKTPLQTLFATDDSRAHRFELTIHRSGKTVNLDGVTVTGYFIRCSDKKTEKVKGEVVDGKAVLTLNKYCYLLPGKFVLTIKLSKDDTEAAVFHGEGGLTRSMTDEIEDDERIILGIDDILAHIDAVEKATKDANEATDRANTAAENADASAASANAAADRANQEADAAAGWADATATIEMLETEAQPSITLDTGEDGSKIVKLKIPRGETGLTPEITFQVATGAPGTNVQVEQSGTAEAPVIKLTIPRGDTGAVEGLDYYENTPKAPGEASPGTSDYVARGDHVHPLPSPADIGAPTTEEMTRAIEGSIVKGRIVLSADDFTGDAAPYTATINVEGITASQIPIIDVIISSAETAEDEQAEFAKIYKVETAEGTMTFYAAEKPESMEIQYMLV